MVQGRWFDGSGPLVLTPSDSKSGECVLVGRFDTVEAARDLVAELLPGFAPGDSFSAGWREVLARDGITVGEKERAPESLVAVGPAVLAHTRQVVGDDFPALRTLLWRRGGQAFCNGIHEHGAVAIATALGFPSSEPLERAEVRLAVDELGTFHRRGLCLFGLVPNIHFRDALEGRITALRAIATAEAASFAAELIPADDQMNLPRALAAPAPPNTPQWLWVLFPTNEAAKAASRGLDGIVTLANRHLLIGAPRIATRVGAYLQRCGGLAELFHGSVLRLHSSYSPRNERPAVTVEIARAIRARLPGMVQVVTDTHSGTSAVIQSSRPDLALKAFAAVAQDHGLDYWVTPEPVPDRLVHVIGRLQGDLARGAGASPRVSPLPGENRDEGE
jgi:hypothetical protein